MGQTGLPGQDKSEGKSQDQAVIDCNYGLSQFSERRTAVEPVTLPVSANPGQRRV
jgi:hypothetical protein